MTDVDIAGFVAQCLDEDTEDAKYVHRWDCDAFDGGSLGDCNCGIPQHLLADIAAKRRRLERHNARGGTFCGACEQEWPCEDVRNDASVYADRPGYNDAWRIES